MEHSGPFLPIRSSIPSPRRRRRRNNGGRHLSWDHHHDDGRSESGVRLLRPPPLIVSSSASITTLARTLEEEPEGLSCTLRIILVIPEHNSPAGATLQAGLLTVISVCCIQNGVAEIKV